MSVAEKTKPTIIQPNKMGLLVENPVILDSICVIVKVLAIPVKSLDSESNR